MSALGKAEQALKQAIRHLDQARLHYEGTAFGERIRAELTSLVEENEYLAGLVSEEYEAEEAKKESAP